MVPHPDRLRVEASPYAPAYLEEVKVNCANWPWHTKVLSTASAPGGAAY